MDVDQNTLRVLEILESANTDKPWMTAKRIADECGLPVAKTQKILRAHISKAWQEDGNPKIRYSNLPSKKTLQVLWGAVSQDKVGLRPLKPLARSDEIDESLAGIELWDSANIFFSHSHRDYDKVIHIAKSMTHSGFSPWLAETHIDRGDYINDEIERALGNAKAFMLFFSVNALNSRWTGKEYGLAVKKFVSEKSEIPIFVIADNDDSILKLLCGLANCAEVESYPEELPNSAREFYQSLFEHREKAKYFTLEQTDPMLDPLPIDLVVRPINEHSSKLGEVLPRPN